MTRLMCIAVLMFASTCEAQPPPGTTRIIRQSRGAERYERNGKTIGSSLPNVSNGRTYYDSRGVYSRSYATPSGTRIITTRR